MRSRRLLHRQYPCKETVNVIASLIHTDDLASKANILIDPAELQAVTMDDLDEDEESAVSTAQVSLVLLHEIG